MLRIKRTDSSDADFIKLVGLLDEDLAARDGVENNFYKQFNTINHIPHVVLLFEHDLACACGAIKPFDEESMEVKRMFTIPAKRGSGFASKVLNELEKWAAELNYRSCVLETGKRQPEAIALYEKSGYQQTPNYGQYIGVENSVCFKKAIKKGS